MPSLPHVTAPGTSAIFDFLWKEVRNLEKYTKNENKSPQTSKRVWGKLEMWKGRLKKDMITDCKYLRGSIINEGLKLFSLR